METCKKQKKKGICVLGGALRKRGRELRKRMRTPSGRRIRHVVVSHEEETWGKRDPRKGKRFGGGVPLRERPDKSSLNEGEGKDSISKKRRTATIHMGGPPETPADKNEELLDGRNRDGEQNEKGKKFVEKRAGHVLYGKREENYRDNSSSAK